MRSASYLAWAGNAVFSSADYRDLADMCRAGAARARDADHRRQMEKLQREFLELAEEAERTERPSPSPARAKNETKAARSG